VAIRSEKEAEVVSLTEKYDALVKVNELFRVLLDRLILDQINKITAIVTEGLQIIGWRDLSFESEVSYKYNKVSVEFFFVRGDPDKGGVRAPPIGSFGGGPTSVASLLLRVLILLRLKRKPMLFLDETLAAVSAEYVDGTSEFLRRFAEKSGVDLLLVTHNPGFMEQAAVAYQGAEEATGEVTRLTLRKIRG
jgi:DNA repair exonuclease SbcCD ATPase subunit